MLALTAFALISQTGPAGKTPAIFRCSAAEAESSLFETMTTEEGFAFYCVEPNPGPNAKAAVKGTTKFVSKTAIDTEANMNWRNATISFVNGRISPKEWVWRTKNLRETVHFLSSPKTPDLKTITSPAKAMFGEFLLLSLPGTPCFTADDLGKAREYPGPGALHDWNSGMQMFLSQMLEFRQENPFVASRKMFIVSADEKPGLLIFSLSQGKERFKFYFNNGPASATLPPIDASHVLGMNKGITVEDDKLKLVPAGFFIESSHG